MKKNLSLSGLAMLVTLCFASVGAMEKGSEVTTAPEVGTMTNGSDEILNIFFCKNSAGAANVLLANGWTQKSLTLLANTTKVAQTFVQEAAVINLGIGFLSDFATDVISSVVAAISTKQQFLCITKGTTVEWNIEKLKKKTNNPNLKQVFCMIFATQPDWTTNFKKVLYMGPLAINANYDFQLGKMINRDTSKVVSEFTPLEQTKSGVLKKLTEMSPEEVAKEIQKIMEKHKEAQEELNRQRERKLQKQQAERELQEQRKQLEAEKEELSKSRMGPMPEVPKTQVEAPKTEEQQPGTQEPRQEG